MTCVRPNNECGQQIANSVQQAAGSRQFEGRDLKFEI